MKGDALLELEQCERERIIWVIIRVAICTPTEDIAVHVHNTSWPDMSASLAANRQTLHRLCCTLSVDVKESEVEVGKSDSFARRGVLKCEGDIDAVGARHGDATNVATAAIICA